MTQFGVGLIAGKQISARQPNRLTGLVAKQGVELCVAIGDVAVDREDDAHGGIPHDGLNAQQRRLQLELLLALGRHIVKNPDGSQLGSLRINGRGGNHTQNGRPVLAHKTALTAIGLASRQHRACLLPKQLVIVQGTEQHRGGLAHKSVGVIAQACTKHPVVANDDAVARERNAQRRVLKRRPHLAGRDQNGLVFI